MRKGDLHVHAGHGHLSHSTLVGEVRVEHHLGEVLVDHHPIKAAEVGVGEHSEGWLKKRGKWRGELVATTQLNPELNT